MVVAPPVVVTGVFPPPVSIPPPVPERVLGDVCDLHAMAIAKKDTTSLESATFMLVSAESRNLYQLKLDVQGSACPFCVWAWVLMATP